MATPQSDQAHLGRIIFILAAAGIIFFLNAALQPIANAIKSLHSSLVSDHVYAKIHLKASILDFEYFENPAYHNLFHRVQTETTYRPTSIIEGLIATLQNTVSIIVVAALFFYLHWSIIIVIAISTIPGFIVKIKYSKKLYQWQQQQTETYRKAHYYHELLTSQKSAKENRLYSLNELFKEKFATLRAALRKERLHIDLEQVKSVCLTHGLSVAVILIIFVYIARQTISGDITMGDFVMYFLAAYRGLGFISSLFYSISRLYEDSLFLKQLYDFLSLPSRKTALSGTKTICFPLETGIAFKNVSFHYPNSHRTALKNINLHIPAGKIIALVGKNGSGKSTLIKLLCGLYFPDKGHISIDNTDLQSVDRKQWYQNLSVIFQDHLNYEMTAADNIWLGNVQSPPNDKKIIQSAQSAGIHNLLQSLPNGYQTPLGNIFSNSEQLSAGEWQRIASARAFLKDAPIMIFDEPTHAMDAEAEYHFFSTLRKLTPKKTVIIISHRFSTVVGADLIYVLDNQEVIEKGTHPELLGLNGHYAYLYHLQTQEK